MPARRLITEADAAEYLGTTVRHLRELRARRELAFVKIGRSVRFDLRVLDRYIDANTVEAEAS